MPDGRLPKTSCMVKCPVVPINEGDSNYDSRMFYTGVARKPTSLLHHGMTWPKTAHSGGMPSRKVWTLLRRGWRKQQRKGTESATTKFLLLLHDQVSPAKYVASSACQRLVCTATPEYTFQTLLSERNHHHLMGWIASNYKALCTWTNKEGSRVIGGHHHANSAHRAQQSAQITHNRHKDAYEPWEDNNEQRRGKRGSITPIKQSEEADGRYTVCNNQSDCITSVDPASSKSYHSPVRNEIRTRSG